jgi:undecaprenyl-diphosphatase
MSNQQRQTVDSQTEASPPTQKRRARIVRLLWRAEMFYAAGLMAFAVLALFAHAYAHFGWDVTVQQVVRRISLPGFGGLMRIISIAGDGKIPHTVAGLTCVLFLLQRLRAEAAGLLLSTGGSGLMNMVFKMFIGRPRPELPPGDLFIQYSGNSFPSGHVTFYVCYFGFLFFLAYALLPRHTLIRRLALLLAVLPVTLVGLSRVHLLAHWPSDTLGAYLFGGVWLAFSLDIYRRWKTTGTN